jgi:hypothetical protein
MFTDTMGGHTASIFSVNDEAKHGKSDMDLAGVGSQSKHNNEIL